MGVLDLLAQGRAAAERLMVDACTITRQTSRGTLNPTTHDYDNPTVDTIYTGKCRVQVSASLDVQTDDFGGRSVATTRLQVSIPVTAVEPAREDTVTITAAAFDPVLVGREFRVSGVEAKTHATVRRLECELID